MTEPSDEIMERAGKVLAGGWPPEGGSASWLRYRERIARAITEAIAAEREECAKVAEDTHNKYLNFAGYDAKTLRRLFLCGDVETHNSWVSKANAIRSLAVAIRARGK